MLTPPSAIVPILQPFSTLFQQRTWLKAQILLVGAILSPRKRTITSALRVMGLSDEKGFAKYHHVLNRAVFSPLQLSRVLLLLLVSHLAQDDEPLVFGIDETIERRWGRRIKARAIYRDAARSSKSHLVKASGLRWISLMWLTTIPWAHRTWALPVLTALAPSERYHLKIGKPHKKITDWARQMILQLRRWLPNRRIVVVADSSYAALDLLHFCQSMQRPVTFITRLRRDAALYEPAPPRQPGQMGRTRVKGQRLPTLKTLLDCPDTHWRSAALAWYDGATRTVQISSQTALWYHAGKPPVPIRWVLIRDPLKQFDSHALLCTDTTVVTGPDHRVVRVALADRGYPVSSTGQAISGGTRPHGSGDSTPVVGSRHSPDHPRTVGTVLLDNSRSPPAGQSLSGDSTVSGLVCQV